ALEVLGGLLNTMAELVRTIAALIRGDWAGAWEHFGHAVQAAFRTVTNTIGSLFPEIQKVVDEIASWIEARFEDMGNAVAGFWDFLTGGGGRGKAANDNKSAAAPKASAGGGYRRAGGFGRASAQDNDLARMSYLADSFGYAIADAFGAAVTGAARFSDVLRGLVLQLADMVMQIAVLEPLAQSLGGALQGVFAGGSGKSNSQIVAGKMSGGGNSGGGFWGAVGSVIGGMFGGMFADGGYLAPGKWGIVGERGPEVVFGGRSGMSVFANDNGASGGFAYNDNRSFDMRGASVEAVQRLERALAQDRADFGRRVMEINTQARRRGAA
ncbi:MAG TPA: hypothetical protein PKY87_08050, partial [Terricaulis sp.]|nr:hypothetical protein [Terricaulis sp.]